MNKTDFIFNSGLIKITECREYCLDQTISHNYTFMWFFVLSLISFIIYYILKDNDKIDETYKKLMIDISAIFVFIGVVYFLYLIKMVKML